MSNDLMEIKEDLIREKYAVAENLLTAFDHTPRMAKNTINEALEKSPGIGTRRRFRSTTPGLITKSKARPEGVRLINRIQNADDAQAGEDKFVSPIQATVLHSLRRALATAMVVVDQYADQTGLSPLLKDCLLYTSPSPRDATLSRMPSSA